VVEHKADKSRNTRSGEEIQIPAGKTMKSTPGKALKESL
jgi:nucleoid DNA-binding protein